MQEIKTRQIKIENFIRYNGEADFPRYGFDDADEMHFGDLDKYFYDIWYPVTDDIDIFDDTFKWLLLIVHNGCLRMAKSWSHSEFKPPLFKKSFYLL